MRRNRVLFGTLMAAAVVAVFAADRFLLLRGVPSAVLLSLVALVASYELCMVLDAAGLATYPRLTAFASFAVALTPVATKLLLPGTSSFAPQAGLIFLFVVLTFGIALTKADVRKGAGAVVAGTFVLVYVGFALSFLVRLRTLNDIGWGLLMFVLACAKLGDVGAYFVGRRFGKHALLRRISPKKTVEGALGALVASFVVAFATSLIMGPKVSLGILLVWAAVISVAAQFGDLCESLLKRAAAVKDSGGFLGKMGGALDIVDSLLLSAPTAYILALLCGFSSG